MRKRALAVLLLAAGTACNNPCQEVCVRMATYADECGFKVPDAELDSCLDENAEVEKDDIEICKDFGDLETIRRQWDCEDLAPYWGVANEG